MSFGRWITPPTTPGPATIRVGITPFGSGRIARFGAGAVINREVTFQVTSALPDATVNITLNDIVLDEDGCVVVLATVTGLYDLIELDWEVVGGGCLVPWFQNRDIIAPTLDVTDVGFIFENAYQIFIATPSGGLYDELIDYEWELVSGSGCLVPHYFNPVPLIAPNLALTNGLDINENADQIFIATPSGGLYDALEYDWEIVSGGGCLVEWFQNRELVVPNLLLTDGQNINENGRQTFIVTPDQFIVAAYDELEYDWEVVSGGGCLVPYFVEIAAPTLVLTNIISIGQDQIAELTITPSGGLYDALEYEIEIVSGGGCLILR